MLLLLIACTGFYSEEREIKGMIKVSSLFIENFVEVSLFLLLFDTLLMSVLNFVV